MSAASAIITIEPLSFSHIEPLNPLGDDPLISRTSSVPCPCSSSCFEDLITQMEGATPDAQHFCVLADGQVVGMTSLKKLRAEVGVGELSFWIGARYQRRGFAIAAARLTLRWGFSHLGLIRIEAHALLKANPGSTAILAKLGFVRSPRADDKATGRFDLEPGDV